MKIYGQLVLLMMALWPAGVWGQTADPVPHLGYLYPAGGRQGTVVEVTAGGQYLQRVDHAYLSGPGVHVSVVECIKPIRPKQLRDLRRKLGQLRREKGDPLAMRRGLARRGNSAQTKPTTTRPQAEEPLELPDHPLLKDLDSMSLRELQKVAEEFLNPKKQLNPQIAESVIIKIAIDPDAPPGDRELRLVTPTGLTNPLCFQVGTLPEVLEPGLKDPDNASAKLIDLPVVLNGQVGPGQVDRFRLRARRGQNLVMSVAARRLIPYLADAVPGWFQAIVTLYDVSGKELAAADDYRFDPDPVLNYRIMKDGDYTLEIRDTLYRGREDFVYRVTVGRQPFISSVFPLGGRAGMAVTAAIAGWNLSTHTLALDTAPGGPGVREAAMRQNKTLSNPMHYAVDTLPEVAEQEPNDGPAQAQAVTPPCIVNGRIDRSGDVDVFRFEGRAGDAVVADVMARRLGSPLDSLLRLTDGAGRVLAWNDDFSDNRTGVLTHAADSHVECRLPKDGTYYVQLSDTEGHDGEEYGYRLRLGPPRPDFVLYVTPSGLSVPIGHTVAVTVYAFRKEGFQGDIDLALKDAPGFKLTGGHLDGRADHVRVTVTGPSEPAAEFFALHIEGRAVIDGKAITRTAMPAEDMMQAFAYHHLAPTQELLVAMTEVRRFAPTFERASEDRVRIPAGGTVQVPVGMWTRPGSRGVQLVLSDPPAGVTLQRVNQTADQVVLTLQADGKRAAPGLRENLIVEALTQMPNNRPDAKKNKNSMRRVSLGVLPAIPIEVVAR